MTIRLHDIVEFEITSIIISDHISFVEVLKMVDCPECGEPLVKRIKSKYFCENESCPVIFVRCPHEPARLKVAFTALTREQTIGKIEETVAESRSHVF